MQLIMYYQLAYMQKSFYISHYFRQKSMLLFTFSFLSKSGLFAARLFALLISDKQVVNKKICWLLVQPKKMFFGGDI